MEQKRRDERVRVVGQWPQPVVMQWGWARATARRWNEEVSASAVRLERGGSRFLRSCAGWLLARGSTEVLSPALLPAATGVWRMAGFTEETRLRLFEHDMRSQVDGAKEAVTEVSPDWQHLARLDRDAFPTRWYLGEDGLREAYGATPRAAVLVVTDGGQATGFAVVGVGLGIGYLQRLAVQPAHQRMGIGRSLVQGSLAWARRHGARTMLLNTQTDNDGAVGLYLGEGFVEVGGLVVMAYRRGVDR